MAFTSADIKKTASITTKVTRSDGEHLVITAKAKRHRLWLRSALADQPLATLIIGDLHVATRAASAQDFHRHMANASRKSVSTCLHPAPSERWRLVQWLRLLDALVLGTSARELAAALIMKDAQKLSAAEWDGAPERKRLARWTEKAVAMRDGRYRELLLGR